MIRNNEMIERVAKAIRDTNANTVGLTFTELSEAMARAAIEAMRDPINPMLHAAAKAMSPDFRPTLDYVSTKQKHRIRYRAMIDAALGKEAVALSPAETQEM